MSREMAPTSEERLHTAETAVQKTRRYTWLKVPDLGGTPFGVRRAQKVYVSFMTGTLRYTLDGSVISREQAVELLKGM